MKQGRRAAREERRSLCLYPAIMGLVGLDDLLPLLVAPVGDHADDGIFIRTCNDTVTV